MRGPLRSSAVRAARSEPLVGAPTPRGPPRRPRGGRPRPARAASRDRRARRQQDLQPRRDPRARAARRLAADRAGRLRRDHGQLGKRQEHADEHPRLPRRPDARALPDRRHGRRGTSTRTTSRTCATARSASSSRASTWCRARAALANVELPLAYAGLARAERRRRAALAAGVGRDVQPRAPPSLRALRRPAAAGGGRASDRHEPRADTRGRADRQPRLALHRGRARDLRRPEPARAARWC